MRHRSRGDKIAIVAGHLCRLMTEIVIGLDYDLRMIGQGAAQLSQYAAPEIHATPDQPLQLDKIRTNVGA